MSAGVTKESVLIIIQMRDYIQHSHQKWISSRQLRDEFCISAKQVNRWMDLLSRISPIVAELGPSGFTNGTMYHYRWATKQVRLPVVPYPPRSY